MKRIVRNRPFFLDHGYDITVYANDGRMRSVEDIPAPAEAMRVNRDTFMGRLKIRLRSQAKKSYLLGRFYMWKDYRSTKKLVADYIARNQQPDIVQFHSDMECYLYLKMRKEHHAKTVLFFHSDAIPFKMELQYYPKLEGTRFLKSLMKRQQWTVSQVDECVFIARTGQDYFKKYYPFFNVDHTEVILNGIDELDDEQKAEIALLRKSAEDSPFRYRLCCTGTINSRKGHRIIVEAMRDMDPEMRRKIHVDFYGEGPERPVLEDLVRELGLSGNISFVGAVPNRDIYKYLAKENIYILMSKNEGLPISIIEAMRAGLPAIASRVSGIPELIRPGYNGELLDPDAGQLRELLDKMDTYDWETMGRNSEQRFRTEFTFDRMKEQLCGMYDKMMLS